MKLMPQMLWQVDRSAYFPEPKCDGAMVDFALRPASARPQLPMTDAQFLGMVRLDTSQHASKRSSADTCHHHPYKTPPSRPQLSNDRQDLLLATGGRHKCAQDCVAVTPRPDA